MYNLIFFEELNSTNDFLKENIDQYSDKTAVYVNRQSSGKGQFERKWYSDVRNNVYMSLLLKPKNPESINNLTIYAGEVVKKTLEQYGVKPQIKLPNDVLINGKKICGILTESIFIGEKLKGVVVGFGINLNMTEFQLKNVDIPATSLNLEINHDEENFVNRIEFISRLLDNFFKGYTDDE